MTTFHRPPYQKSPMPPKAYTPVTGHTMEQQKDPPLFVGWALLPMRLFLGITFVYAGVQKLTDPQFFHRSTPGYIGNQLIAFAHGSPLHDILMKVAVPHAALFGLAIAFGEIAIGLGALFGLLFRPAAFFGLILSLTFFLTASWHVYPYFYGSDIVFAFCWLVMLLHGPIATGYPALDTWLITALLPSQRPGLRAFVRVLLIGSFNTPQTGMLPGATYGPTDIRTPVWQETTQPHVRTIMRRKRETRRSFLLGTITGASGIVGLGIIGLVLNSLFSNGQSSTTQPTTSTDTPPQNSNTTPGTSTGSGTVIAHVSTIAKNDSTTFAIPSTGDPGVLIHLPNDQFVAYDAICTHAGCPVDYDPTSQHLVCPCHGATYDPAQQAAVLGGPTNTPLTALSIQVEQDGSILLNS